MANQGELESMVKRGIQGGILRPLTNSEIKSIHTASLEVLEQVGLQVQSERIMDVFKSGGAEVDAAKSRQDTRTYR